MRGKLDINQRLSGEMFSDIEKLLTYESIDVLAEYVLLNQNALDFCNQLLYRYANKVLLKTDDLKKCETLLKIGANPDYIHDNDNLNGFQSVLQSAASNNHSALIEMLLAYNANPILYVTQKPLSRDDYKMFGFADEKIDEIYAKLAQKDGMSSADKTEDMFKRKKLPLQIALKDYKERMGIKSQDSISACELLSQATISACEVKTPLINILTKHFIKLQIDIALAVTEANRGNKQLIIMIGECHTGIASLIIQQMALLIAKTHKINLLLTEHNKFIERCLKNNGYIPTREREWSVSMSINKQLPSLQIQSVPIDLGHWGAKKIGDNYNDYEDLIEPNGHFENTSPEGMKYRNEVIRSIISEGIKENCLLVVGADHLYGLLEETPFPEEIYVLAICAENETLKSSMERTILERYALESPRIIRPEKELDDFCKFLSPEVAIEYVNNVHYSMHDFRKKFSFFSPAYQPSSVENYAVVERRETVEENALNEANTIKCVLF